MIFLTHNEGIGRNRTPGRHPNAFGLEEITDCFDAIFASDAGQRAKDGLGGHLDISLMNAAMSLQQSAISDYLATGELPSKIASAAPYSAPNEAFETAAAICQELPQRPNSPSLRRRSAPELWPVPCWGRRSNPSARCRPGGRRRRLRIGRRVLAGHRPRSSNR
jgi:CoA-transferase family III